MVMDSSLALGFSFLVSSFGSKRVRIKLHRTVPIQRSFDPRDQRTVMSLAG
jgi:hypothetical protein